MTDNKDGDLKRLSLDFLISQVIEDTACMEYLPHEINHMSKAYLEIKRRLVNGYEAGLDEGYAVGFNEGCCACSGKPFKAEEALEKYYENLSPNSDSIDELIEG